MTEQQEIDAAFEIILTQYNEDQVREAVDDQILEYVDPNLVLDGHDAEYEWYIDHCNGEAEDDILGAVIDWFEKKHGALSTLDARVELGTQLREHWEL